MWFAMGQILAHVSAVPRLAPIWNPRTYLWPPWFPTLLVVPAFGIDLVRRRFTGLNPWLLSLALGAAFVVLLCAVQWPMASFMVHGNRRTGSFTAMSGRIRRGLDRGRTVSGRPNARLPVSMIRHSLAIVPWLALATRDRHSHEPPRARVGRMDVAGAAMMLARPRGGSRSSPARSRWYVFAPHTSAVPTHFSTARRARIPCAIIIRSPAVIPARAEIIVRVTGAGITRVTATARVWGADDQNAPPPDDAVRVAGDSTLWTLQLWMMRQGSYAVIVHVDGAAGGGTATVPFTAVAQGVLGMNRTMAFVLAVAGMFLVAGMLTIIGAAAGEATVQLVSRAVSRSRLERGADPLARARRSS